MDSELLEEIYNNPLLIICDTCVYTGDFTLKNGPWKKIKSILFNHPNSHLILPEAIEKEIEKKILDMGQTEIENLHARMEKFQVRELSKYIDLDEMENELKSYASSYVDELIKTISPKKIKRTPFPQTDAKDYFLRATECKKPHKAELLKGGYRKAVDGFRDAVIWESVKEVYVENKSANLLFITFNSKDFSGEETGLIHDDFKKEIDALTEGTHKFHYITDEQAINSFLEKVELADKLTSSIKDLVKHRLRKSKEKHLFQALSESDEYELIVYGEDDDGEIAFAEVDDLIIETYYKEINTIYLAEGTASIIGNYQFYIDKSNYYSLSSRDRRELSIEDGDVNDHVMLCSKDFSLDLHFIASIDLADRDEPKFTEDEGLLLNGVEIL